MLKGPQFLQKPTHQIKWRYVMNIMLFALNNSLLGNLLQDGPFPGIGSFQNNYFFSGGIGLWLFFLLLAIVSVALISYETQKRNVNAPGLKIGAYIALALLLPSLLFKFTVTEQQVYEYYEIKYQIGNLELYQEGNWIDTVAALEYTLENTYPPLTSYLEVIMLLGILGGLGGLSLVITFYIIYQGEGGRMPQMAGQRGGYQGTYAPPPPPLAPPPPAASRGKASVPRRANKTKASAWLVTRNGKNYQLFVGETVIGRSSKCDIQIIGDTTLSKRHAKFIEKNGRFKLHDLASTNGVKINGKRLRQPVLLAADDQIQLGDDTFLKFVTS